MLSLGLLLLGPSAILYSYSFQYQPLFLLDVFAGFSNFATSDLAETPNSFAFADQIALTRYAVMPQGEVDLTLILRNNYLVHFQVLLNNLRSQQSNLAFGLGNENAGLLLGVAQEFTIASTNRPNQLGFGIYTKAFYNLPGLMDLQLVGVLVTNTFSNTNTTGYRNIYTFIQALFMASQLRIGMTGTIHFLNAIATGPDIIQMQGNFVLGGSAPARLFLVDFYFSVAVMLNQGIQENNYSVMFLGVGIKLKFALYHRVMAGFYFEAMPFGITLNNLDTIRRGTVGITFGVNMSFRISRKELWSPEIIPHHVASISY